MSADDIYARVLDGMGNLTEASMLSVIRRYIPYIFGKDAQVVAVNDLKLSGFDPDFVVKIANNEFAIIEARNQTPNPGQPWLWLFQRGTTCPGGVTPPTST
jgi:hypothetical protein